MKQVNMTRVEENVKLLKELLLEKECIEKKISDVKKEISDEYLDYIKERLKKRNESYIFCCGEYFHLGEFECLGWCGKKNAKRKKNYSNDYDAYFKLIHGFRFSLPSINEQGLDIEEQPCFELNTDIVEKYEGEIAFRRFIQAVSKEEYEEAYESVKKRYEFATTKATTEDSNGEILHIGDRIIYTDNRKAVVADISMIDGKRVYVAGSMIGHLSYKTTKLE